MGARTLGEASETGKIKKQRAGRKPASKAPKWVLVLGFSSLIFPAGVTLFNYMGPEQWWWSAFNLYLPQFIWAIPALAVLPIVFWRSRRLAWIPIAAIVWVVWPLMGLCIPSPIVYRPEPGDARVRVMTFNIKNARRDQKAVMAEIKREQPDLLIIQDMRSDLPAQILKQLPGYDWREDGQFAVFSRLPISRLVHHGGRYARCEIESRSGPIIIYDVHLASPRYAIASIRHVRSFGSGPMENNAEARWKEAESIGRDLEKEIDPTIVAGDLNAPLQSLTCREFTSLGFTDAFAAGGLGYGYTYGHNSPAGRSFMRIDHILISRRWISTRCFVGDHGGSDHRPVIAELILRSR